MVKIFFAVFVVSILISDVSKAQSPQDPLFAKRIYRVFKDFLFLDVFGRSATDSRNLKQLENIKRVQNAIPKSREFPCKFREPDKGGDPSLPLGRSEKRPTSVHKLRPGDIDVIAAMGDSLTAGNGAAATNILQVFVENKGLSWSIGGQGNWRRYLTLPNILRVFNPKLIGFSLGDSFAHHKTTQFNVAEIGAMSKDLPYMAKELVKRMSNDKRVDIKNDWKLITLMMGANDFCLDFCYTDTTKSAENHRRELLRALKTLKKHLPRTLVSLVIAPDVNLLKNFTGVPPLCDLYHVVECPCFYGEPHKAKFASMTKAIHEWQDVEREMESHPELNDSDDFAVVFQPFVKHVEFPKINGNTDITYLSQDCFHFSQKGYARASNALWNNMMEPVGQKSENWDDEFRKFLCPTIEQPYIFTPKNTLEKVNKNGVNDEEVAPESTYTNLIKRGANFFNIRNRRHLFNY